MAKKSKTPSNHYFTKVTQEAIVKYATTQDLEVRTQLYVEHIQPALSELVDKIVFTYKFTSLDNIDVLKEECKIWLTTILDKFDEEKGKKAFSYYSVITKNWFTHKAKKQTVKHRREINYDTMISESELVSKTPGSDIEQTKEEMEFWKFLLKETTSWSEGDLKENERKVVDAVNLILNNINEIEIFNKKAIYLYLREITGLNTKQVVTNLNRLRVKYRDFKSRWDSGQI